MFRRIVNWRRFSQALFLLLFLFLFLRTESTGDDSTGYPVKIFLDFDPLLALTTFLVSWEAPAAFLLSISVVILTLLTGRTFCGWICPFGTIHHMISSIKGREAKGDKIKKVDKIGWHSYKYLILIFLVMASLFSLQLTGIFDPISFLIRSLALSVHPAFQYSVSSFFNYFYELQIPVITDVTEWIYAILKKSVLAFRTPYFRQVFLIGALFFAIIFLNLYRRRFWCRYICPLGALLGLFAKYSIVSRTVSSSCSECGKCTISCAGDANPMSNSEWNKMECMFCWNCSSACESAKAVKFSFFKNNPEPQKKKMAGSRTITRKEALIAAGSALFAVPFFRISPRAAGLEKDLRILRPPGALKEPEFLQRCIKCGECMKVCITGGLQPALFETGPEGIWTPVLVPEIGYCEHRCTLCGQTCPTGAIENLTVEKKMKFRIGTARVDRSKCIPWISSTPCIVCEEVCPTSPKAIYLKAVKDTDNFGVTVHLERPYVDSEKCIGCAICETKCPLQHDPAIYVVTGETES